MSAPTPTSSSSRSFFLNGKRLFFLAFALMTLFVMVTYELGILTGKSPALQHFVPRAHIWLLPHGIAGAAALLLAPLQFSNRLRQRNLQLHRILGRIYVGSVAVAAPFAVPVAVIHGPPELTMAAVMQSSGWLITTGIALYCIRTGNIQQHRQWMIRSYPFAMVFVVTRALFMIPAIQRLGLPGVIQVVWSSIFLAAFLPTLVINWTAIVPGKKLKATKAAAA